MLLMGITLVEKLLSFVYQAMIAAKLGATTITDSYFAAAEFFTMIDAALFGALTVVLLNQYTNTLETDGESEAYQLLSNVFSLIIPVSAVLGGVVFCFADTVAAILAPGFGAGERQTLVRCLRWLAIVPVAGGFFTVYQTILRQQKKFVVVSLKSLFISVFGIIAVSFFANAQGENADAVCLGYVISMLGYCACTFLTARKCNGTIRFQRPKLTEQSILLLRLMVPLIISKGITQISLMVDKILASLFGDGKISCLTYSQTLYYFVVAFFVTNICTILLTDFANLHSQKKYDAMQRKGEKTVRTLLLLLLPITILTVLYHREIVAIVFERGNFTGADADTAAELLMWYALGFIPAMIQNIYLHVHYAFNDTVTAMKNGIVAVICNFVTSMGLAYAVGINGIAIGTVVSTVVSAGLSGRTIKKHLPAFKLFADKRYLFRVALAALACAFAAKTVKNSLQAAELSLFLCATVAGFAVFFVVLLVFREPIVISFLCSAKKQLRKHENKMTGKN